MSSLGPSPDKSTLNDKLKSWILTLYRVAWAKFTLSWKMNNACHDQFHYIVIQIHHLSKRQWAWPLKKVHLVIGWVLDYNCIKVKHDDDTQIYEKHDPEQDDPLNFVSLDTALCQKIRNCGLLWLHLMLKTFHKDPKWKLSALAHHVYTCAINQSSHLVDVKMSNGHVGVVVCISHPDDLISQ